MHCIENYGNHMQIRINQLKSENIEKYRGHE
jgi:hypothetical protein